jgi:hypothetical protein
MSNTMTLSNSLYNLWKGAPIMTKAISAVAIVLSLAVPVATVHAKGGNAGGTAVSHASGKAIQNSNAAFTGDKDKGQLRAQERHSASGALHGAVDKHGKAAVPHGRKKHP